MKHKGLLLFFLAAWLPVGISLAGSFRNGGYSLTEAFLLAGSLIALLILNWRHRKHRTLSSAFLLFLPAFVLYTLSRFFLPPLGVAIFGALSLGAFGLSFLPEKTARKYAGLIPLLACGLPVAASAQFLLGYPLQRLTALIAATILSPLDVTASGTGLAFPGGVVMVDPSCSGVAGFTIIGAASLVFAILFAPGWSRLIASGLSGIAAAVLYNTLRACWLFMVYRYSGPLSESTHALIGIIALLVSLFLLLGMVRFIVSRLPDFPEPGIEFPLDRKTAVLITILLALSFFTFLIPPRSPEHPKKEGLKDIPALQFDGQSLRTIPFDEREARFYSVFPGTAARFTDGRSVYLVRRITRTSRNLHSAAECYRALGFDTRELTPEIKDFPVLGLEKVRFSRFAVTEKKQTFEVLEVIVSEAGSVYLTPSEWYWKTALGGKDPGPWTAYSVKTSADFHPMNP